MIKYNIFIDESGDFAEGLRTTDKSNNQYPSLVGGVCSLGGYEYWEVQHKQCVGTFNNNEKTLFFYPEDFHCGPLFRKDQPLKPNVSIPEKEAFAAAVFNQVCANSKLVFVSYNRPARFAFSCQATYGINLVACLRTAFDALSMQMPKPNVVCIVVAQRTIDETSEVKNATRKPYIDLLRPFLFEQLQTGTNPGASLAKRLKLTGNLELHSGVGDRNPGLMAADFVCNRLRRGIKPSGAVPFSETKPDDVSFGDYECFYKKQIASLMEHRQYCAVLEISRCCIPTQGTHAAVGNIMASLRQEQDIDILQRELSGLLIEAKYLIDHRTRDDKALQTAKAILEDLTKLATDKLNHNGLDSSNRCWAEILIEGLRELGTCHNHLGETKAQAEIEDELKVIIDKYAGLLSLSAPERKEFVLETQVRNLNQCFNDYQFEKVIEVFERDVVSRKLQTGDDEIDPLLGKMLGSMGQAYAFLAKTEPDWTSTALDYFEQSRQHFSPGSTFDAMALNYLTTLFWQKGSLDEACAVMNKHVGLNKFRPDEGFVENFTKYVCNPKATSFDVVNYLRIGASLVETTKSLNWNSWQTAAGYWQNQLKCEHPNELIAKWLAYLAFKSGQYVEAEKWCDLGVNLTQKHGFTTKTILLCLKGLKVACVKAQNRVFTGLLMDLKTDTQALCLQSQGFETYMENGGGVDGFIQAVSSSNPEATSRVVRWLPFYYS